MNTPLENEIAKRFGVLPNFFGLAPGDPQIAANLWGFAQFAYLDNPLPSLFKERLFVYLSRFCEVRYCIARHLGFLTGLGHAAGDASCPPQTVESMLPLLRRHLPRGEALQEVFAVCSECDSPLTSFPAPDSREEQALFTCATHVFLQTPDASKAHEALRSPFGPINLEQLNLLLAFVRTAHYWTRLHPELVLEHDIAHLLATHETLAECVLRDPEAQRDTLSRQVATELKALRKLRTQHESMARAFQELSVDHQYAKYSLRETEENLRELISVMPASVYACDRDGVITYFNPYAVEIWGRTPDLDDSAGSFLDSRRMYRTDGTPLPPEEAPVRKVLATGIPVINSELVVERPDFSRVSVLANITPLRDSAGIVSGAVCIFQDITELKHIQQERENLLRELERSNRDLSQFSYAVSHDLKAPVHHVRALTQLLVRRGHSMQEDSSHLLTLIEQAADRMERLIESLLRYAQAGQGSLERKRVPVNPITEAVLLTLAPAIASTRAQIVCKPLPVVEADPVLLEQLFQNLIANAIQYHRPEEAPVVEISGEASGDEWRFAVKDNGEGISPDYQHAIFEPLKRLHGDENAGSGLGLALCRTIVTRHGGRIWVESEGIGRGSTFSFTLSSARESPKLAQSMTVVTTKE